jgi:hypothetical protein
MGAELSIVNDVGEACLVEIWTWGGVCVVQSGSIVSGDSRSFSSLGAVAYDVRFSLWRMGIQQFHTKTFVFLQCYHLCVKPKPEHN